MGIARSIEAFKSKCREGGVRDSRGRKRELRRPRGKYAIVAGDGIDLRRLFAALGTFYRPFLFVYSDDCLVLIYTQYLPIIPDKFLLVTSADYGIALPPELHCRCRAFALGVGPLVDPAQP